MIKKFFKRAAEKRKKKLTAKEKGQPAEKEVLAYKSGKTYFKKT